MLIPKKYEAKGRQHQVVLSLPSKQATFIKKYIKQFNDKRRDIEFTLEDFLATFVDEFYATESVKTQEQRQMDREKYLALLDQQQREVEIQEIEKKQAELEKKKQKLLAPPVSTENKE